jgi:hypothetical protein
MKYINKSDYNKKYYQKNKDKEKARAKKYREENIDKVKLASAERYKKNGKKYRQANLEAFRKRSREWARKDRLENPEKYKKFVKSDVNKKIQKRYRDNNRDKISKNSLRYSKERLKTDTNYRLMWLLRSRINIAIKRQLGNKAYKTVELLGCSVQEAREHLEKQFLPWMTWENHGTWEIDHIMPVSSFDLTKPEEQKKCFNYKNLQPLEWRRNRQKSNRIVI